MKAFEVSESHVAQVAWIALVCDARGRWLNYSRNNEVFHTNDLDAINANIYEKVIQWNTNKVSDFVNKNKEIIIESYLNGLWMVWWWWNIIFIMAGIFQCFCRDAWQCHYAMSSLRIVYRLSWITLIIIVVGTAGGMTALSLTIEDTVTTMQRSGDCIQEHSSPHCLIVHVTFLAAVGVQGNVVKLLYLKILNHRWTLMKLLTDRR